MEQKKRTGYPSIDKPWMKYYSEEAVNAQMPCGSMYDYLYDNNAAHLDEIAMDYFGRKITYRKLFLEIGRTKNAFAVLGLKEGDIVTGIAVTTPEIVYAFYALNSLGIVSSWLNPRSEKEAIERCLKNTKSRVCLVSELFLEENRDLLQNMADIKIIVLSFTDSAPLYMKPLLLLKKAKIKGSRMISYADFITEGTVQKKSDTVHDGSCVAVLEYTGGTTGESKAVMLTNQNCNAVVEQYRLGGTPLSRDHSWLTVAFPFTAYSLICSMHLPISLGMTAYLCYSLEIKKIINKLLKKRINHVATTPLMWEQIACNFSSRKLDFSFLVNPTVGADSLDVTKEQTINDFLEQHGCKCPLVKGYGMTEVGSAVSVCISRGINKPGSVGIPFCNSVVSVFDWETGEELPYNHEGEICICGPGVMKGYYNDETQTKSILRMHADGKQWIHSGDIGFMDEDGFIFIIGRRKRMIIDHYGFKIFAPLIESELMKLGSIEKVCVVGVKDERYGVGQVPICFILSRDGYVQDEIRNQIRELAEKKFPDYYQLEHMIFVSEFPYTGAAKVDYRRLEKLAEEKMGR